MLTCGICNTGIGDCTCPGRDDQLRAVAYNPESHVAFKWCRKCDKHYARCRCDPPEFYVILAGKDQTTHFMQGVTTLGGNRIAPDLEKR